jgi:hypothetical protein
MRRAGRGYARRTRAASIYVKKGPEEIVDRVTAKIIQRVVVALLAHAVFTSTALAESM